MENARRWIAARWIKARWKGIAAAGGAIVGIAVNHLASDGTLALDAIGLITAFLVYRVPNITTTTITQTITNNSGEVVGTASIVAP